MTAWIYKQTEPRLWTAGHMEGDRFVPESDHGTSAAAAERVRYLNGGAPESAQRATETVEPANGVTITIDPAALLEALIPEGYDYDTDEEYGAPVRSKLLTGAAKLLADRFEKTVADEIRAVVAAQVERLVAEVVEQGVRPTNTWGEPTGAPTTVASLIRAEAERYLNEKVGDYRRQETRLRTLIREEVERKFAGEVRAAVDAGKAEALTAVRAKAAEVVTETIARAAGVKP